MHRLVLISAFGVFATVCAAFVGLMLYLLNLPFVLLAIRYSWYGVRFRRVLRLPLG